MRLPRALHRAWARLGNYFWMPCPLCGQMFGGHEWRDIDGKPSSAPTGLPGQGRAICPDCTRAGRGERSVQEAFYFEHETINLDELP